MKMKRQEVHQKGSTRLIIGLAVVLILLLAAVVLSLFAADELVDIWWFHSLGYEFYYWQRKLYRYLVFGGVSLIFFLVFFLNFWIAARFLKKTAPSLEDAPRKAHRRILRAFQTGSLLFYGPLSLALSIPIAMPLYRNWERFLFFVFGPSMGVRDAFFGRDVAFYLFSFPVYRLLQRRLLIAFVILVVGLLILYIVKNHFRNGHAFRFSRGATWHLSFLILAIFGIEIWDFMLQRFALVYDASHGPLFFGPGYVQMKVILPFIWATMVMLAGTALALVTAIQFRKGYFVLGGCALLLAGTLAVRYTTFLPRMVQTYMVKPNEIDKEQPYISQNIQATLAAYNLTQVDIRDFRHQRFPLGNSVEQVKNVLRNIPVWDPETLDSVFKQLQELRTYYTFPLVSVGRYTVAGNYQQVFLSPRELSYDNLPAGAKNWINAHLIYTHGFGVVMTPASQVSGDPMTWFINNIPPESQYGLNIEQPRIYYGMGDYPYVIAPNKAREMDYPKGNSNETADYQGQGGVPISSLFKKFLFAYYLKDRNIFFSTKFGAGSKILFRRNILDRVHRLVPYLTLDKTPYVAVTPKGIYWIIDAYTTSSWYPGSAPFASGRASLNYIRNSVKIVVDAYNGSVDFYVFDPKDPIAQAYRRIYPGLFKAKEQMPEALKPHVRYPKDLFDIQMRIYAKYHQTDPQVFYQQEDLWTFAETLKAGSTVPLEPYYLTLDLINPGRLDFLLLLPMFPKGRDNLRSLAIVGCDGENYGKITMYNFPKGELVYGPAQIDALINQDPAIAQQFTLWDQAGSSVVRGKMIILPLEKSVLFIQPVYLKSTSRVNIPELQRIIMSEGQVAVMETSLEKAYGVLRQRVAEELKGVEQRFPQVPAAAPGPAGQEAVPAPAGGQDTLQPGSGAEKQPDAGQVPAPAPN
jgi:uncharacterized protein